MSLRHNYAEASNNLGLALQDEHRYTEARAAFDRALADRPDFAEAHWNRALLRLLQADFAGGWEEYEWRLRHPQLGLPHQRPFARARWDGRDPRGKRLFVYAEQGYGDALQFVRYLPLLIARGADVVLEAALPLCRLFTSMQGVRVVPRGETIPPFDFHCPLLSLPLAFATTRETIASMCAAYVSAPGIAPGNWATSATCAPAEAATFSAILRL